MPRIGFCFARRCRDLRLERREAMMELRPLHHLAARHTGEQLARFHHLVFQVGHPAWFPLTGRHRAPLETPPGSTLTPSVVRHESRGAVAEW